MSLHASQLESLLLLASKPLKKKSLAKALNIKLEELDVAVTQLTERFNKEGSGIHLIDHNDELQFTTAKEHAELVQSFYQSDLTGDLTKPALETLTIIAYRGPITKPELELIRGINCSLILRNLAMRGLIHEEGGDDELSKVYSVDSRFLHFLGIKNVNELPQYEELHAHELLDELLKQRAE